MALCELAKPDVRRPSCDTIDLFQGAIFILNALYSQHAAGDRGKIFLDVPGSKRRIQPDVVPTPKRAVHIVVITGEALAQIGGFVGEFRSSDTLDR